MAEMTIRRFAVLSVAKIYCLLLFIIGVIVGVLYGLMFMLLGATMSLIPQSEEAALGGVGTIVIGLVFMIVIPIMYGVLGFISGAISALIYNMASRIVGGIKFELEHVNSGYIPPAANQWPANPYPAQ